mmetsp:Transcript_34554/g.90456  ORF Transcript_34554/g.90456 Transcript_34554/m.90456 type:complete len:119 (+) Transcript_34554:479-835(+)
MSSRLRSSARHHVVALAGAAPRNAQLAWLVWRGRRRASPLNRLSCPVLCVFSGYVLNHHSFLPSVIHQFFSNTDFVLLEWRGSYSFFLSSSMLQFIFVHLHFIRFQQPPTHPGVRGNT